MEVNARCQMKNCKKWFAKCMVSVVFGETPESAEYDMNDYLRKKPRPFSLNYNLCSKCVESFLDEFGDFCDDSKCLSIEPRGSGFVIFIHHGSNKECCAKCCYITNKLGEDKCKCQHRKKVERIVTKNKVHISFL